MPERYRLNAGHYIHALQWDQSPTEWEYQEQSLVHNRIVRRRFKVPMLLDPNDVTCHNYPGEIIVSTEYDERHPQDIIFEGEPTPDMTPLNKEAKERVEQLSSKWVHPIEALPGNFSQSLLNELEKQFSALQSRAPIPAMNPVQTANIDNDRLTRLEKMISDLAGQNAALQAKMAGADIQIDTEEPLPPVKLDDEKPVPPPTFVPPKRPVPAGLRRG